MKKNIFLISALFIIASCALVEKPAEVVSPKSSDIEKELVADAALELRQNIYGTSSVKSLDAVTLTLHRIDVTVKSSEESVPYVVNYPDNEGYAIMLVEGEDVIPLFMGDIGSFDPQILQDALNGAGAVSSTSSFAPFPGETAPDEDEEDFDPEDALHGDESIEPYPMDILPYDYNEPIGGAQTPPGYNNDLPFVDYIVDYVHNGGNGNRLDTAETDIPGTIPNPPTPCPDSLKGKWLQMWGVAPLLKTAWRQSEPYNQCCPEIDGENALAGCVPVAVSQIGAYLAPPGKPWDWELMTGTGNDAEREAAEFIAFAGDKVNADYGLLSTSATNYQAKRFLKNEIGCDYVSRRKCKDFSKFYERVTGRLKYHLLVYLSGYNSNGEGHAYIIDGYVEQKKYIGDYAMERRSLFHVNWGWGDIYNGWCLVELLDFRTSRKDYTSDDIGTPKQSGSGESIYDGAMETMTYAIPDWMQ